MLEVGQGDGAEAVAADTEQLALLHEVRGEEEGEEDLGELTGLEADGPDAHPDLGSVDGLAHPGDEREQQQGDAPHPYRPAVALEVSDATDHEERGDERHDADRDPSGLQAGQPLRVGLGFVDADDEDVAEPVEEPRYGHEGAVRVGGEASDGEVGHELEAEDDDEEGPDVGWDGGVLGQAGQQVGADGDERPEDDEAELGVPAHGPQRVHGAGAVLVVTGSVGATGAVVVVVAAISAMSRSMLETNWLALGQRRHLVPGLDVVEVPGGDLVPQDAGAVFQLGLDPEETPWAALEDRHLVAFEADEVGARAVPLDGREGSADHSDHEHGEQDGPPGDAAAGAAGLLALGPPLGPAGRGADRVQLIVREPVGVEGGAEAGQVALDGAGRAQGPAPVVDDVEDESRDVVAPATFVGQADELVRRVRRLLEASQHRGHLVVRDLVEQPVRAEEVAVAADRVDGPDVDLNLGVDAEDARDDVALGVGVGLFLADATVPHQLGHDRVVVGQLRETAVSEEVGPAVAHVDDEQVLLSVRGIRIVGVGLPGHERDGHGGGAHALEVGVAGGLVDLAVGLGHGRGEGLDRRLDVGLFERRRWPCWTPPRRPEARPCRRPRPTGPVRPGSGGCPG